MECDTSDEKLDREQAERQEPDSRRKKVIEHTSHIGATPGIQSAVLLQDDEALLGRAADDPAQLELLYVRYHASIHDYVLRLSGDAHLADRLVREVLAHVARRSNRFRDALTPAEWILAVAHQMARHALREHGSRCEDENAHLFV